MKMLQQMQTKMAEAQSKLAAMQVEGSAGGGAVKVTANGDQELVSVSIEPELAEDMDMLQDLVLAAANDALRQAKQLAAGQMQQLASGLGLPPGIM
ncbi:MAG: YbaB/EbfC family nucleoid-associated protein [Candidatus Dormibacteraceae bacterium]